MKRKMILSSGVLALLSLVGCGGGGGSTLVNPSLVVNWAERTRAINAPSSAQSVKITLDSPQPSVADVVWVINRGSNLAAFSQSYTSPEQVPSGAFSLRVELFSDANAAGTEVGEGVLSVNVGQSGEFRTPTGDPVTNIAIDRTIKSVQLNGASVQEGATIELSAAGLDGTGGVVPVTVGSFKYAVSSGSENISLLSNGTLSGLLAGKSTVTAAIDGVTSADASVSVTPLPENYIRVIEQAVNDVELLPDKQFLYAAAADKNQILRVNLATGASEVFMNLPFTPGAMALSNDGSRLYVGAYSLDQLVEVQVASASIVQTVSFGSFLNRSQVALDLSVDPSNANRWAVAIGVRSISPPERLVRVYNGQTIEAESSLIPSEAPKASHIFFTSNGAELVTFDASTSEFGTRRFEVTGGGLVELQQVNETIQDFFLSASLVEDKLVYANGTILNVADLSVVGNAPIGGNPRFGWQAMANPVSDRAITFQKGQNGTITVRKLSTNQVLLTHSAELWEFPKIKPLGTGGFAISDDTKLTILRPVADF